MTGPPWNLGLDLARFTVQHDEDEYAYAVGPLSRPGRYLGITLVCRECDGKDAGRIAARDADGDEADLAVLVCLARQHWQARHAPPDVAASPPGDAAQRVG